MIGQAALSRSDAVGRFGRRHVRCFDAEPAAAAWKNAAALIFAATESDDVNTVRRWWT